MTSPSKTQDGLVAPKNRPRRGDWVREPGKSTPTLAAALKPGATTPRSSLDASCTSPGRRVREQSALDVTPTCTTGKHSTRRNESRSPLGMHRLFVTSQLTRPLCHRCRGGTSPSPRLCSPAHTNARGAGEGAGPNAPNAFRTSASSPGRPVTLRPGP